MPAAHHRFRSVKWISCILIPVTLFIVFPSSHEYMTQSDSWSTSVTRRNSSCKHDVHIYTSRGTVLTTKRCYPLLINFAHQCCRRAQQQNCVTGLANGIQQCLKLNMRVFDHDHGFFKMNEHILLQKRGAGYWLWKPYVLLRELYLAEEGDVIVYSDAAVDVIENIDYLVRLTQDQDVITFEQASKVTIAFEIAHRHI